MENHWISQSNVQQRAGRAGRVQTGQCFHLFSRKMFEHFEPFPKAEIHRIPLEKVLLDIKVDPYLFLSSWFTILLTCIFRPTMKI